MSRIGVTRPSVRAWAIAAGLPLTLVGVFAVRGAVGHRAALPWRPYAETLPLIPVEFPGPWWRRHRRWLVSPGPLALRRHAVVNRRTNLVHAWTFKGNRHGRGWFGVSTRWAMCHPAWKDDPWDLLYDPAG